MFVWWKRNYLDVIDMCSDYLVKYVYYLWDIILRIRGKEEYVVFMYVYFVYMCIYGL